MIRDPSDGSVREEITPPANKINEVVQEKPSEGIMPGFVPGIRQPTRTDAQERLERSREWLKDYHHRKEVNNADGEHDDSAATKEG